MSVVSTPGGRPARSARDPLVRHYVELVELIEGLVIARLPRLPLMPAPRPLDARDRLVVAERLAAAHDVRARQ